VVDASLDLLFEGRSDAVIDAINGDHGNCLLITP